MVKGFKNLIDFQIPMNACELHDAYTQKDYGPTGDRAHVNDLLLISICSMIYIM